MTRESNAVEVDDQVYECDEIVGKATLDPLLFPP